MAKKEEGSVQGFSTPQRSQGELKQLNKVFPQLSAENAKIIEEMLRAGCTKEDIFHSLGGPKQQDEPLFVTPLASKTREQNQISQSSVQKQGIKLKFGKSRVVPKTESPVPTEAAAGQLTSEVQTQVSTLEAKKA